MEGSLKTFPGVRAGKEWEGNATKLKNEDIRKASIQKNGTNKVTTLHFYT